MSIKLEVNSLRERNEELSKLIKKISKKLDNEESQQKSIREKVNQFAKRKSELANELHEEYKQKLEVQTQKVNEIVLQLKQYQKEKSEIEKKIKFYLEDTSLYINEQVLYLIEEFQEYVEKNKMELGLKITSEFVFEEINPLRSSGIEKTNADFCIKRIIRRCEDEVIVVKTKDYYFDKRICNFEVEYIGRSQHEIVTFYLEDWYITYREDFKKALMEALLERFKSKNFKLTIDGNSFTLDLI